MDPSHDPSISPSLFPEDITILFNTIAAASEG